MTDTTAQPAGGTARIPGSKSITNRALLLAAAARGTSRLRFPLVSTDTVAFRTALADLGFRVGMADRDEVWEVTGAGRGPTGRTDVWCEDAGTAARCLPPFAAVGHGRFVFDGSAQLREELRRLFPVASQPTSSQRQGSR